MNIKSLIDAIRNEDGENMSLGSLRTLKIIEDEFETQQKKLRFSEDQRKELKEQLGESIRENSLLESKIEELKEDLANKENGAPWISVCGPEDFEKVVVDKLEHLHWNVFPRISPEAQREVRLCITDIELAALRAIETTLASPLPDKQEIERLWKGLNIFGVMNEDDLTEAFKVVDEIIKEGKQEDEAIKPFYEAALQEEWERKHQEIEDDEWEEEEDHDQTCSACGCNYGNHLKGCPEDDSPFALLCRRGFD